MNKSRVTKPLFAVALSLSLLTAPAQAGFMSIPKALLNAAAAVGGGFSIHLAGKILHAAYKADKKDKLQILTGILILAGGTKALFSGVSDIFGSKKNDCLENDDDLNEEE